MIINPRAHARSSHRVSPALLSLLLVAASSCGGTSTDSDPRAASQAVSTDTGWEGLWIDDKKIHLQFAPDGRFATFRVSAAVSDLRFHECGENKYGERTIPTLNKAAGWDLEGDKLVSYKRPMDPARKDERIAGRSFRRLTADEKVAYWNASSFRLVRKGKLSEIKEAEAAGFRFSTVPDSSITIATEGQNTSVDMLDYAVKTKQREVAEHFMEQGYELYAPKAAANAIQLGDAQLIARLADHGLPLQEALQEAIAKDAPPEIFEVLFAKGATAESDHLARVESMMVTHKVAVRALFESQLEGR